MTATREDMDLVWNFAHACDRFAREGARLARGEVETTADFARAYDERMALMNKMMVRLGGDDG